MNDDGSAAIGFQKAHDLSVTIGSEDSGDDGYDDEVSDMRSRMQSFAMGDGAIDIPPTLFIEDTDVIGPTTSSSLSQHPSLTQQMTPAIDLSTPFNRDPSDCDKDAIGMEEFVKGFFSPDAGLLQPKQGNNFVEEIFAEKQPKIVNNYLFGQVVGEGSYSRVKEVLHIRTLIRRAVKIIKDKRLRKIPGGEQNVQQEIGVLQGIDHKNVVKLIELFRVEEKQKLYIVMEFCVCSLQQLLDNCSERILPEFQAHLYFTQILDGLDHLHNCGIIHKDIKPGNLLLSLQGVIKICDLGVAEILYRPDDDWCTLAQGTPKFQPPEVVSGMHERFRGRLVDIWSCGVTLYNIISADYPFDGDVIMKLFENITSQPLKMPESVILSKALIDLLTGILTKDPNHRWDSKRIRSSEWFATKHEIDHNRIVRMPPIKDIPAHHPISVFHALEQLYGSNYGDDIMAANSKKALSNVQCPLSTTSNAFQQAPSFISGAVQDTQPCLAVHSPPHEPFIQETGNGKYSLRYSGSDNQDLRRRNSSRREFSVAKLRQIFFIAMCIFLVLATGFVLWLML